MVDALTALCFVNIANLADRHMSKIAWIDNPLMSDNDNAFVRSVYADQDKVCHDMKDYVFTFLNFWKNDYARILNSRKEEIKQLFNVNSGYPELWPLSPDAIFLTLTMLVNQIASKKIVVEVIEDMVDYSINVAKVDGGHNTLSYVETARKIQNLNFMLWK